MPINLSFEELAKSSVKVQLKDEFPEEFEVKVVNPRNCDVCSELGCTVVANHVFYMRRGPGKYYACERHARVMFATLKRVYLNEGRRVMDKDNCLVVPCTIYKIHVPGLKPIEVDIVCSNGDPTEQLNEALEKDDQVRVSKEDAFFGNAIDDQGFNISSYFHGTTEEEVRVQVREWLKEKTASTGV